MNDIMFILEGKEGYGMSNLAISIIDYFDKYLKDE